MRHWLQESPEARRLTGHLQAGRLHHKPDSMLEKLMSRINLPFDGIREAG
jgi:hypothetical protein